MVIRCVWEHNGNDTLLYAMDYPGAYARGNSLEIAKEKMPQEVLSYLCWVGKSLTDSDFEIEIVQEKMSQLQICDADSDVIFESECAPLQQNEYEILKSLALKSAASFYELYTQISEKNQSCLPERKTFYGFAPRTAEQMYQHTKNVNAYYFGEIGVDADNEGTIISCRERGFQLLEQRENFLENTVFEGSYGEMWTLRKILRRFIWHDRIHAKAMCRMAYKTFGTYHGLCIFGFDL